MTAVPVLPPPQLSREIPAPPEQGLSSQGILFYGALLARNVELLMTAAGPGPAAAELAAREGYTPCLHRVLDIVLERAVGEPAIAEHPALHEIQAVLGVLAADSTAYEASGPPPEGREPAEQPPALPATAPVDYDIALQNLRHALDGLSPGRAYRLTPAQLITLAGPHMAFSRWQRWRLLRRARQMLPAEGYVFDHNNGRGASSAYTVGRSAAASPLPAQEV